MPRAIAYRPIPPLPQLSRQEYTSVPGTYVSVCHAYGVKQATTYDSSADSIGLIVPTGLEEELINRVGKTNSAIVQMISQDLMAVALYVLGLVWGVSALCPKFHLQDR